MSILIVDDENINLTFLQNALESEGYADIHTAESAAEALLYLEMGAEPREDIDLILMDIMMPEIDGIEACRRIRLVDAYGDVPIIMITASTEIKHLKEAFEAGATDYVTKPINMVELFARIRVALRLKYEMDRHKIRDKKITEELDLAKKVQRIVLTPPIREARIDIEAVYLPSEKLAGDMYAWYRIDENRYGVLLFEVIGHGVSASLVSMSIHSLIRDLITRTVDPVRVVHELERHILELYPEEEYDMSQYFTILYLVIDVEKRNISYINASHPPGIVLFENEGVKKLDKASFPVGLISNMPIETETFSYDGCLRIAMFTDGFVKAFGEAGYIEEMMEEYKNEKNAVFIGAVRDKCVSQKKVTDDICFISISAF